MVILLAATGIALIAVAAAAIRLDNKTRRTNLTLVACGCFSPDQTYACEKPLGHDGWCSAGDVQWAGDVWAIGWFDQTCAAPAQSYNTPPLYPALSKNADPAEVARVKTAKKQGR